MTEERVQRRLAAILAADVVSYSRLMREDETGTLAALMALLNRFWIAPGFTRDPVRTGHYLRLSIGLELTLALLILILVAVFGTLSP